VALLNHPGLDVANLCSLEALISLGETLHVAHKERLCELLPNRFYEMYGLAEGFMTILDRTDVPHKLASVGVPPPFFEMRILDENGAEQPVNTVGEIAGRGPILMKGYHDRPDLTSKAIVDNWLRSGDLGYVDEDGYLFLVDRKKELIKSGGVSVYPRDIEEVISTHPTVTDVAVFGVPHQRWGETPIAAVVLSEGSGTTAEDLKTWVNSRVKAKYQRIANVIILPRFPRNAAGKTLKRVIRDEYLRGAAAE
jgi:acyl-CoA synthetase (AMP-forming)/AMP-acid ligase II